jgi:hypothetical protein
MREASYLVAARTRAEILVLHVKLLNAEGAALLFVIVDELILLDARHGGRTRCAVCSALAGPRFWGGAEG